MMICTAKPLNNNQSLIDKKSIIKQQQRPVARWKIMNGKLICQWIFE